MRWNPVLPLWILLPVPALLAGLAVYILLRRKEKLLSRLSSLIRLALIAALIVVTGARPMRIDRTAQVKLSNLDVLFVVDNTMSMYALDYHGRTRMSGALADCKYICEQLAGANFALIAFDDRSNVLAPFTQDVGDVLSHLALLEMPYSYDALGTDLRTPETDLESLLISSSRKEGRKTIVFFLGDGEITRGDGEMPSYAELAHYISGGAVLGYGTEEGGRMKNTYGGYVYDYETHRDARSVLDEENLKRLASDLGISYVHMTSQVLVDPVISSVQAMSGSILSSRSDLLNYSDTYYYYVIPLILLLLWELALYIRKGRL